jgi:hypothetical protein
MADMQQPPATGLRLAAERRARELGYASVEAMLEEAYAAERPWTEVAAELGLCKDNTVSKWARKLGMVRGERWNMARRGEHYAPRARVVKAPEACCQLSRPEVLAAAIARAAARVPTPAARRSLARCQHCDPAGVDLRLTPAEEAEWAAYHCQTAYLED